MAIQKITHATPGLVSDFIILFFLYVCLYSERKWEMKEKKKRIYACDWKMWKLPIDSQTELSNLPWDTISVILLICQFHYNKN